MVIRKGRLSYYNYPAVNKVYIGLVWFGLG